MVWKNLLRLGLGLAGIAQAQTEESTAVAFTDSKTGIVFQQTTKGDYSFGISLPAKSNGDFIGRISNKGAKGWAGVSLGGPMANSLMVIVWPNDKKVVATVRHSQGYSVPNPVTNATVKLMTIPEGTVNDGSSYTYTFLCKGCIQTDGSTFKAGDAKPTIGYGTATAPPTAPENPLSPMAFHDGGFGLFQVEMKKAETDKFDTFAKKATEEAKQTPPAGSAPKDTGPATVSGDSYDYIVIGAGPAGLIAATRLAEAKKSVLLLERGGASTFATGGKRLVPWNNTLTLYDVPALFLNMAVRTLGEGYCKDTAAIAGCILGGGGSMNGMAFIRPPKHDFDDKWPKGWKWNDVKEAADRLYERNPGTTLPSKDGKYYDNALWPVMEEWFKSNGWNYADSIEKPDDKDKSYGHPAINVS